MLTHTLMEIWTTVNILKKIILIKHLTTDFENPENKTDV